MPSSVEQNKTGENGILPLPVVLSIMPKHVEAQQYLNDGNEVLRCLYGSPVIRVDIDTAELGHELFWRSGDEELLAFLNRYPNVSISRLEDFVRNSLPSLVGNQIVGLLEERTSEQGCLGTRDVRVVLVYKELLFFGQAAGDVPNTDSPMAEVLRRNFRHAALFTVESEREVPVRVDLQSLPRL